MKQNRILRQYIMKFFVISFQQSNITTNLQIFSNKIIKQKIFPLMKCINLKINKQNLIYTLGFIRSHVVTTNSHFCWPKPQRDEYASCSILRIAINDYYFILARLSRIRNVYERVVCGGIEPTPLKLARTKYVDDD